jgi:peptidoglycan glycosyltransferase
MDEAIALRPNGVEWDRAVELIRQELSFRLSATDADGSDTAVSFPVVPVDTTDELLLAEAEQAWADLGGYAVQDPEQRGILVRHLNSFIAQLHDIKSPQGLTTRQDGFQLQRSLFALRAGGVRGTGLGKGRPEAIPRVTEDLAIIAWGEATGLIGIVTASGTVLLLAASALRRLNRADMLASLLLVGLGSQYAIQAIVNAGGIIGALPFTGIPFPFISRSGTAAVGTGISIGLLIAVLDRQRSKRPPMAQRMEAQTLGLGAGLAVVGASFALLMTTGSRLLTPGPLFDALHDIEARHLTVPDQWERGEYRIATGPIVDRHGKVMMATEELGSRRGPIDPVLGQSASHLVRRLDTTYAQILNTRDDGASLGPSLVTTIDADLQRAATLAFQEGAAEVEALAGTGLRGSLVLLDPATGEILAMVSVPTFEPDELLDVSLWAEAEGLDRRSGYDSRYLNRAIDGLYPPGFTFKTVTAAGALDYGLHVVGEYDFRYNDGPTGPIDPGFDRNGRWHQLILDDRPPVTGENHSQVEDWTFDLADAFAHSCNVAFAQIGLELGAERLIEIGQAFGFERTITVPGLGITTSKLDTNPGAEPLDRPLGQTDDALARTSFGQGEVLASPLHMAMIAAAVANDGVMMSPRIVAGFQSRSGEWLEQSEASVFTDTGLSPEAVDGLQLLFQSAVDYGTAGNAAVVDGLDVGAKTGTAEWTSGEAAPHSWLIATYGSSPHSLVLAVLVEEGGSGGQAAAHIAGSLFGSNAVSDHMARVMDAT